MLIIFLLLHFLQGLDSIYPCPLPCTCKKIGVQAARLKIICQNHLQKVSDVDIKEISIWIDQLDLSKNDIRTLEKEIFVNLTSLRRLDLSNNKIVKLAEGVFEGLGNLKKLDLSKNHIASIELHAFKQLINLKTLKLEGNNLMTLKENIFYDLVSLKQLDVSDNPWKCDCNLYWFSNWIYNASLKLSLTAKCDSPANIKGQPIIKLRIIQEIQCNQMTPTIEILPGQNQVVFTGDSLTLKCRAPSVRNDNNAVLNWSWNPNITDEIVDFELYRNPQESLSDVTIENRYLSDSGIVDSSLSIVPIKEEHGGQWNCLLVSAHGNDSKSINLFVISDQTKYCSLAVTTNNKGTYTWPRTVVGWKAELPCEGSELSGLIRTPSRATYFCNESGDWTNLNTDSCPYVSPTTKILEQFSKVNLSLTKSSLLDTVKKFRNYTNDSALLTDPVEINFISETIKNYLSFLDEEKELSYMLIDIISYVQNLPKQLLKDAEINYGSCTKLVNAVETITALTPSIQLHKKNMALEEFEVDPESFTGLTCTWYSGGAKSENSETRLLYCATNNKSVPLRNKDKSIEASIQLPSSLFKHLPNKNSVTSHQLMISMYSNNQLFPSVLADDNGMDISSSVIGSKLIGVTVENLTEPVYVMMKAPLHYYGTNEQQPVVWDPALNGTGGWTNNGCHIANLVNDLILFHCDRLGYYGLLWDVSIFANKDLRSIDSNHPSAAIYFGSSILISCLMFNIFIYIWHYSSIMMLKETKHSFVNVWIAIALLCGLYTIGIHETYNVDICQGIGLVLHYLSLCCLLWMIVCASNMYKRFSSCNNIETISDDESLAEPLQKPLMGLYLVGWGIALAICGISGAVNLREYAGYTYCFLSSGPALAALFVPAIILLLYIIVLDLLIGCAIRKTAYTSGQASEVMSNLVTENLDLESLEQSTNQVIERTFDNSMHGKPSVPSEVDDLEHSQMSQLYGQIVVMLLYLLTWVSAALAVSDLLNLAFIPYNETIFSILYAISASSLGVFILVFYGIGRSDVKVRRLSINCCWFRQRGSKCCRTRNISDTNPVISTQPLVMQQNCSYPLSTLPVARAPSDTNSNSSSRYVDKLNGATGMTADSPVKPKEIVTNSKFVVPCRQQCRSNNSVTTYVTENSSKSVTVEMFYNPHQSDVARKFFKKQRRYAKKNNNEHNLNYRKQNDGDATSDKGSCVSVPRSFAKPENSNRNSERYFTVTQEESSPCNSKIEKKSNENDILQERKQLDLQLTCENKKQQCNSGTSSELNCGPRSSEGNNILLKTDETVKLFDTIRSNTCYLNENGSKNKRLLKHRSHSSDNILIPSNSFPHRRFHSLPNNTLSMRTNIIVRSTSSSHLLTKINGASNDNTAEDENCESSISESFEDNMQPFFSNEIYTVVFSQNLCNFDSNLSDTKSDNAITVSSTARNSTTNIMDEERYNTRTDEHENNFESLVHDFQLSKNSSIIVDTHIDLDDTRISEYVNGYGKVDLDSTLQSSNSAKKETSV